MFYRGLDQDFKAQPFSGSNFNFVHGKVSVKSSELHGAKFDFAIMNSTLLDNKKLKYIFI